MAGDEFGNSIAQSGDVSALDVTLQSNAGSHNAKVNVTDLGGGLYGVAYQTTRAG